MTGRDPPAGILEALRRIVQLSRRIDVVLMAAGLAYYGLVSMLPLAVLAFVVIAAIQGEEIATVAVTTVGTALSVSGQATVRAALGNAVGQWEVGAVSAAILLWGSLRLFRALTLAFDRIYGRRGNRSAVSVVVDSALALGATTLGVAVTVGASIVAHLLGVRVLGVAATLAQIFGIAIGLFPLYYVFPEAQVGFFEAVPGPVVAACGLVLLQAGFRIYLAFAGQSPLYGAFGGVLLVVTWLYVIALVLLLGGVVNVVLAGRERIGPGRDP
ncbi:YihY/virulence factor BrkB family protein [Halobacteriales archaeon QS_1_68_17]|nr:MAG: YihY/virulence factor BrkB family protein [Halobacteriales archaeon QS_1_68_17]